MGFDKLQEACPFNIAYKNESWLMWVLSKILFFVPEYMEHYVTTFGNIIYFPSREWESKKSKTEIISFIAHEQVHIQQSYNNPYFKILYLIPQIFTLFAILFPYSWYFLFFLLFLFPFPAYFRMKFEKEAFEVSKFVYEQAGESTEKLEKFIQTQFRGSFYYYMWPFGVKLQTPNSKYSHICNAVREVLNG